MDWLRRFMIGRYGPDQLGVALLIVYLILIFFAPLTGLWIFRLFALAVLILCLFRMLSRNTARRYQENLKFLAFWNPIKSWFQKKKARFKDSKTHRYYKCPNCKSTLRVPRGKGGKKGKFRLPARFAIQNLLKKHKRKLRRNILRSFLLCFVVVMNFHVASV